VRCVHEAQMHESNSFVTLTYRDEELCFGYTHPTLEPRLLQLFLKRLRKKYGNGIRFFACGEYGSDTRRPHYHAAIFGLDFEDKKLCSTKNGNNLYHSDILDDIWTHGYCTIGDVTFESAAYVARYIMDKQLGPETTIYQELGIEPEFVRMSRRPGIGKPFYDRYKSDLFPQDKCIIRGGIITKPPKYYMDKYSLDNPEKSAIIKSNRKTFAEKTQEGTSKRRLHIRESVKKAQISLLLRHSI